MKIGIYDLNECSSLNYKERLEIYKECGFTSVGVYLDDEYMCSYEKYIDIVEYAREIGLTINQVHVDYKISNLICDDENIYFDYVEKKLIECIQLKIPFMVLHASKGDNPPFIKENSIKRLEHLMKKYVGCDVYLCFENVRDNKNLDIILSSNINNIGMCYDMGHAYCYDNEYNLLNKYKNQIKCTHLHNNFKVDSHNCLSEGDIDYKKLIAMINEIKNVDNCLEIFPQRGEILNREQFVEFVNKIFNEYKSCCQK